MKGNNNTGGTNRNRKKKRRGRRPRRRSSSPPASTPLVGNDLDGDAVGCRGDSGGGGGGAGHSTGDTADAVGGVGGYGCGSGDGCDRGMRGHRPKLAVSSSASTKTARKKRRRRERYDQPSSRGDGGDGGARRSDGPSFHPAPSGSNSASASASSSTSLPPHFPESPTLPLPPSSSFLRPPGEEGSDPRYGASFGAALDTCHEGVAFDLPSPSAALDTSASAAAASSSSSTASLFPHSRIRGALRCLSSPESNLFRTDVTQPLGLGTKCAPTRVTRCLLGERGTTYKYLGLRMFSHPWDGSGCSDEEVREALGVIRTLNEMLEERARKHLSDLDVKRKRRGAVPTRGRAKFDVTLINRMVDSHDLKAEPMSSGTGDDERCSVSWHADSSLEHYSTIAVYHTIFREGSGEEEGDDDGIDSTAGARSERRWSVALRVAPHSEGPTAGGGGINGDTSTASSARWPAIAVSLPSGSAYYLLDDYNHHHQHAVLVSSSSSSTTTSSSGSGCGPRAAADSGLDGERTRKKRRKKEEDRGKKSRDDDERGHHKSSRTKSCDGVDDDDGPRPVGPGVRYSSTHRLLRHGQNVNHILERCKSAISKFHRRGVKIWRSEQLLLTEIESEWIRQFYVQGRSHRDALWEAWREPICSLLRYWSQLEQRTGQVVNLLMAAAEERCGAVASTSRCSRVGCVVGASVEGKGGVDGGIYDGHSIPSGVTTKARKDRKERDRRRKAAIAVANVLGRGHGGVSGDGVDPNSSAAAGDVSGSRGCDATQLLYDPVASLLEERAEMRRLWAEREADRAFRRVGIDCRPLPPPLAFGRTSGHSSQSSSLDELGVSPLDDAPEDLLVVAKRLRQCGRAYMSCDSSELPYAGACFATSWSTPACAEKHTNKRTMVSGHDEADKESVSGFYECVQTDRTMDRRILSPQKNGHMKVNCNGARKRRKKRRY